MNGATKWQPIETAPVGKRLIFWWRPIDGNPYAETVVIGQLSYGEHEGQWWSDSARYQDAWHLTRWMQLPTKPEDMK